MRSDFVPLQYSLPEAVELLLTVLISLLVVLITTIWVYRDATRRRMNAALWAALVGGILLVGFVPGVMAFVVYLWKRADARTTSSRGSVR